MKEKEIELLKKIIKEEEKDYDFNDFIWNWIDEDTLKELETSDVRDYLEELNEGGEITDTEIIYYSNAIKYLQENDPSLSESLSIAYELGYSLKDITSEVLASLLATENNKEDYVSFCDKVMDRFESEEVEK